MKHIHWLLSALFVVAIIGLSSCSKVPSSARLIPKDASLVVRVDVKQIAEKAGKGSDDSWKKQLKEEIRQSGMSRDAVDLLLAIVDKPKKLGLDLRDPLFVYMRNAASKGGMGLLEDEPLDEELVDYADTAGNYAEPEDATDVADEEELTDDDALTDVLSGALATTQPNTDDTELGIVATVYDADDFAEALQTLSKDLDIRLRDGGDGIRYVQLDEVVMAFDADHLLLLTARNGEQPADLLSRVKTQLAQDKSESLAKNDFFRTLCRKDGDIQMLWLGSSMADDPVSASLMMLFVSPECKLADIAGIVDIDMQEGRTVITSETLTGSKAWKKQMEQWAAVVGDIDGDLCQYFPADADLVAAFHFNGDKLAQQIANVPFVQVMPSSTKKNILALLKGLKGDAMMGMSISDDAQDIEGITAYIHADSHRLVDMIAKDMGGDSLQKVAANCYRIDMDGKTVDFGWKNGLVYVALGDGAKPFKKAEKAFDGSVMGDRSAYFRMNLRFVDALKTSLMEQNDWGMMVFMQLLTKFESMEIYADGKQRVVWQVSQKDKSQTLIGLLTHFVTHLPEEMMQMAGSLELPPDGEEEPIEVDTI